MLTRKHFAAIAAAMAMSKPAAGYSIGHLIQWESDCKHLATALARENPAFDRSPFLAACGVEE